MLERERERTCSGGGKLISLGVSNVEDEPSLEGRVRTIKIRQRHVNAGQSHLTHLRLQIKDHPNVHRDRCWIAVVAALRHCWVSAIAQGDDNREKGESQK